MNPRYGREISPALNASVEEYLQLLPADARKAVEEIRRQKLAGVRVRPSLTLVDHSAILTPQSRAVLLDKVAALVDENYAGRSEMCLQFADLLNKALVHLKFPSRAVVGTALFYDSNGLEIFRWDHSWVRIGDEVIDGNTDCLAENPMVPNTVAAVPYWGPIAAIPVGRRLRENRDALQLSDPDVEQIWWPDLITFINDEFLRHLGGSPT